MVNENQVNSELRQRQEMAEILFLLQKYNNQGPSLKNLLDSDQQRFSAFSRSFGGLLVDFSRNAIDAEAFELLLGLARASGIEKARERLFAGEAINVTEQRAVLHPLWRSGNFGEILADREVQSLTDAAAGMRRTADSLHRGRLPGSSSDQKIYHLVHIGIGGSLLGPRMLCDAFPASGDIPQIHFLSSVDAWDRERLLARIDPAETAVVLVSKSFTTSEVLLHANHIRQWQLQSLDAQRANDRFFAVTASADRAREFGVPDDHVLQMGSWTGGRFSLWSPVGLTAAVAMGIEAFDQLLEGGASMDRHFREAPLADNLPVLLGLLSVWNRNICARDCHALIPYDSRLKGMPGWLQQVEMESNGKSVTLSGETVDAGTSPVIFGDCGTDAQHALFQAFHQGTSIVPLDFIGVVNPEHDDQLAQQQLLSHMLAQATALAIGRDREQTAQMMRGQGLDDDGIEALLPHRIMPGERPSNIILLDELSPANLGRLLVLYEHKVFVESVIWDINAFDQWGVELGKTLAQSIQPALAESDQSLPDDILGLDGLIDYIRRCARKG
jgi:glucose-6-phosphate isomerase